MVEKIALATAKDAVNKTLAANETPVQITENHAPSVWDESSEEAKKEISVYYTKNSVDAQEQINFTANRRLSKVSETAAIMKNKTVKRAQKVGFWSSLGLAGLFAGVKLLGAAALGGPIGVGIAAAVLAAGAIGSVIVASNASKSRNKALNSNNSAFEQMHNIDNNVQKQSQLKIPKNLIESVANVWETSETYEILDKDDIKDYAKDALKWLPLHKINICISVPEDKNNKMDVRITKIKSDEFTGEKEKENEQYIGIEDKFNDSIPNQYEVFIKTFIEGSINRLKTRKVGNNLTTAELERLTEILKALHTDTIISTEQAERSLEKPAPKEDIDFFDITGDGVINRGDFHAIKLHEFLKKNDKYINISIPSDSDNTETTMYAKLKVHLQSPKVWNNNTMSKLIEKVSDINPLDAIHFFDLNNDGHIDANDCKLYNTMNFVKTDINNDGKTDDKDAVLLKAYFKGITDIYHRALQQAENIEESVGGKKQLKSIHDLIYPAQRDFGH